MRGRVEIIADVSRETRERLDTFVATLLKWNRTINLISRRSAPDIWNRHIADSLQLFQHRANDNDHWVDIGTGGGFPGLVLAIAARDYASEMRFTLVESDARKAAFLHAAAEATQTQVTIHCNRAERLPPLGADILSARALAPLPDLLELLRQHALPNGRGLFPKGRGHGAEIKRALENWRFEVHKHSSLTDPSGVILDIKGVARARDNCSE